MPSEKPNFTSLPAEIIAQLASQLDHETAISFALCCKAFFQAAQDQTWKELDLDIHPYFGEYPRIAEYSEDEGEKYTTWLKKENEGGDSRRKERLRKKLGRIIMEGDERRIRLVEKIRMVPRPSVVNTMMALLDLVSPNLIELVVEGPLEEQYKPQVQGFRHLWELKWLDSEIRFTSLRYLNLGPSSFHLDDLISFICIQCPNLLKLDIDRQHYGRYEIHEEFTSGIPIFEDDTRIEEMRLRFIQGPGPELDHGSWANLRLFQVVEYSPNLRQLSMDYQDPANYLLTIDEIDIVFARSTSLQDLEWVITPRNFTSTLELEGQVAVPNLRRLVLYSDQWGDMLFIPAGLPKLETFCLVGVKYPYNPQVTPSPERTITPNLVRILHSTPDLRNLHILSEHNLMGTPDIFAKLDQVEASGGYRGEVRSYRHKLGQELLHFLPNIVGEEIETSSGSGAKVYTQYTEYKGICIPLEIIKRMQQSDRKSDEEWHKRGVEVGDEGWRCLLEWYEFHVVVDRM